jgi:hypothetical protein
MRPGLKLFSTVSGIRKSYAVADIDDCGGPLYPWRVADFNQNSAKSGSRAAGPG